MSLSEWLVIGLGLALGWVVVSFLFRSGGPPPKAGWEQAAELAITGGPDTVAWWLVLGVKKTASPAEVRAAYEQRVNQLVTSAQTIETAPESARRDQLLAVLQHACERGTSASYGHSPAGE